MKSLIFLVSLAISAGLCIIVGALGISLKPRDQWGDPHVPAMVVVLYMFLGYLVALVTASVQAADYPILRAYLPGCYAAGILVGSAGTAYWVVFPGCDHHIMFSRCIFSIMVAIYSGILFEIKTRAFTNMTTLLDRSIQEKRGSKSAVPRSAATKE